MFPLSSAHLTADVLQGAQGMATGSLALYSRPSRAHIAAALRWQVRGGLVAAREVRSIFAAGIAGTDGQVRDLGSTLVDRARARMGELPRLTKASTRCPFNPKYDDPQVRNGIVYWGAALMRAGAISWAGLARALARGGANPTMALRGAGEAYANRVLNDMFARYGCAPRAKTFREPFWQVLPAILYGITGDDAPAVVMATGPAAGNCSFTLSSLDIDMDHADAPLLCALLSKWPSHALTVLAPHEFVGDGYLGNGQFWDDVGSYGKELLDAHGNVALTDDFLEHMEMEYGYERESEEDRDTLERCVRFLAKRKARMTDFKSRDAVGKAFRRHLKQHTGEPTKALLSSLLRLNEEVSERLAGARTLSTVEAMCEEGYGSGLHIVKANFCGIEDRILDEHERMTWETGSDGTIGITPTNADPWKVFELCVIEACAITVMSYLISQFNEAQRD